MIQPAKSVVAGKIDLGELGERRVSITAREDKWSAVVETMCRDAGVSCVMPETTVDPPVTISLADVRFHDAAVALGKLREVEPYIQRGVLQWRPASASSARLVTNGWVKLPEAQRIYEGVVGEAGRVRESGQSIVVLGDEETLDRAGDVAELLEVASVSQWVVSVWVLELQADFNLQLGVELTAAGSLQGLVGGGSAELIAEALLDGVLVAEQADTEARVLQRGTLVFVEGEKSRLQSGQTVPVPQRTVSPQGTVTTSSYQYVDVGLIIEAEGRRVPGGLMLTVRPEVSSVVGFVDDAPIVGKRALESRCMVRSGDWVVLAGLDDWREGRALQDFGVVTQSTRLGSVLVVMRAVEVGVDRLALPFGGDVDAAEWSTEKEHE